MPHRSSLDPACAFVAQQSWFGVLAPAQRAQALALCGTEHFSRGETVQRRRSANTSWYGVMEGRMELRLPAAASRKYAPHLVEPGQWFGEDLRAPSGTAVYDAVAVTPVVLAVLPLDFFRTLMDSNYAFCRHFAAVFWERLAQVQHSVAMCSGTRVERVAAAIISHWDGTGTGGQDHWIEVNQGMLARFCGLSRQRTNYCLRDMERDGLLERGGRRIRILDRMRMEHLAWQYVQPTAQQAA